MDVSLPDGTVIKGVPDGMSKADLTAKLKANGYDVSKLEAPAEDPSLGQRVGNLAAGAVRGAGSIGATLLAPVDAAARAVNGGKPISVGGYDIAGQDRREGMDSALTTMGADKNSLEFKGAKLGTEVAGTLGVGGGISNALRAVPAVARAVPNLLNAIGSSGMAGGNAVTRAAGGAITGAASAGLVNPDEALAGAAVGGVLPGAAQLAGKAGVAIGSGISDFANATAKRLMQSAIKPTIAQLKSGEADTAVQTLLDYGINPTKGGVNKLQELIDAKNSEISNAIGSSTATIDKQNVLSALGSVRQKFGNQVSPTNDLASIQGVADDFIAHPNLPGNSIPVQAAQDMKQGTYRVLNGKYGQMGSAETEAQKGLARGLKDEIATAVPAVGPLNAEESRLITTLNVSERRALMEMNKNPMGLASLAKNPVNWAMFMADKSALFKSLAARVVNQVSGAPNAVQALGSALPQQLGYRAAPVLAGDR